MSRGEVVDLFARTWARRRPAVNRVRSDTRGRRQGSPLKISFFGHFGSMNAGNESTLLAILLRLRHRFPACEFQCICTNPDRVAAKDGIEAVSITNRVVRIWDREARLNRRLRMFPIGVAGELMEVVRAFRTMKGTD